MATGENTEQLDKLKDAASIEEIEKLVPKKKSKNLAIRKIMENGAPSSQSKTNREGSCSIGNT